MFRILNTRLLYLTLFLIGFNNLIAQDSYHLMKENFEKGRKALKNKSYIEALGHYQTASVYDPEHSAPQIMAGNVSTELEYYSNAIDYYEKVINENSDYTDSAFSGLGNIYGKMGYDDLALEMFSNITDDNHTNKLIALGAIAEHKGDLPEAFKYMYKASEVSSGYIPYFNLGVLHTRTNNYDSAVYYFDKVIKIAPQNPSAYTAKLEVLTTINKPQKEYVPLCKKIIGICSKNTRQSSYLKMRADAYKALSEEEKMKADLIEYLKKLNHFIELYPKAYTFITDRAIAYTDLGNTNAAITDYKRALNINPHYPKAKKGLAELLNE